VAIDADFSSHLTKDIFPVSKQYISDGAIKIAKPFLLSTNPVKFLNEIVSNISN
jgi:hypothetical protein